MAHAIVEYTANLDAETDIDALLAAINGTLIAQAVFPLGGIRSRAIRLDHYRMSDGAADYAFVHVTLKIGAGRDEATKRKACDELFEAIKRHFAELYARRLLALSMELHEFDEHGTYKHNNVHAHLRRAT